MMLCKLDIEGLSDVIVYPHPEDPEKKKNRGFCFLEFAEHKSASQAKRRLSSGRIRPWNCDLVVDWAEPLEEPDADAMSQVIVEDSEKIALLFFFSLFVN